MRKSPEMLSRHKLLAIAAVSTLALLIGPASSAMASTPSTTTVRTVSMASLAATKAVPDEVGKTAKAAKAALTKAGFTSTYRAPKGSVVVLSKAWTVTKQNPKANTIVKAGTKVKLTVVKTATLGAPTAAAAPALTVSQTQAKIAAQGYLKIGSGFSYQGLIDQLDSPYGNAFSAADATVAVNSLNADYNAQAVLAAKGYLTMGGFSHASLVSQLTSSFGNKFTPEQGEYAATKVGL